MRTQRGFSLIELLIVVAIILVIAAIAIPNLMSARMQANEASAVACMRTINTAQTTYQINYSGYADNMTKLGGNPAAPTPAAAGLLDWVLGCAAQPCPKTGYNFTIANAVVSGGQVVGYDLWAWPITTSSGKRSFCSNQLTEMSVDDNGGNPPVCTRPLN
jgi:prepilin-type N-terminal cleavage/methylation domain-containing protein